MEFAKFLKKKVKTFKGIYASIKLLFTGKIKP
jgi:hypothetical protein